MKFYLGTHMTGWLADLDVPLFVSHKRLRKRLGPRASLPRAVAPWALDSGGFTEVRYHGRHLDSPMQYAAAVRRYADEIGKMEWAAPQDFMCEPFVLERTGLTVAEHQALTVRSFLTLRNMASELPWIPVLQGWSRDDYLRCADLYERAGVNLAMARVVGVGSVCRRQNTAQIADVMFALEPLRLRLHGFGVKTGGLERYGGILASADSMAWSFRARRSEPLPGCSHKACNNCPLFALRWRADVVRQQSPYQQLRLGDAG